LNAFDAAGERRQHQKKTAFQGQLNKDRGSQFSLQIKEKASHQNESILKEQ